MKMIRYGDIGVDLPTGFGIRLAQRLNKALAIRVILEDWLTPVPAIHDVKSLRIFDSQLARHVGEWQNRLMSTQRALPQALVKN